MSKSGIGGFMVRNEGAVYTARTVCVRYDSADAQHGVIRFYVVSRSRPSWLHTVEASLETLEIVCSCEMGSDFIPDRAALADPGEPFEGAFRESCRSPYRREAAGAYLEHLAWAHDFRLSPVLTRSPSGMCPHCRIVRKALFRRGLRGYVLDREAKLIGRLEALKPKSYVTVA